MKNPLQLNPKDMVNTYLLFFVMHSAQIGVGVQGFQRIVFQDAKHDAWISVLLAGIATHIVTFFMIKTLEIYGANDLYGYCQYFCVNDDSPVQGNSSPVYSIVLVRSVDLSV
ncbi:GerAB/ArcD/ProY family transporter [Lysinibacillus macroides]|uniref:GerAB/ArcD/ProY family transporter n=1 Tax=Lysinibacillus macroides TaxID=33935 RepID=UPI0030820A54